MASKFHLVLDTNVLISALINDGAARRFVRRVLNEKVKVVLSDYIINEVEEVLKRKKFSKMEIVIDLWEVLKQEARVVSVPVDHQTTTVRDPKDHPILLTAVKSGAEVIVTGDGDLLVLKEWKGVRIVKMSQMKVGNPLIDLVGFEKSKTGAIGLNIDEIYEEV